MKYSVLLAVSFLTATFAGDVPYLPPQQLDVVHIPSSYHQDVEVTYRNVCHWPGKQIIYLTLYLPVLLSDIDM